MKKTKWIVLMIMLVALFGVSLRTSKNRKTSDVEVHRPVAIERPSEVEEVPFPALIEASQTIQAIEVSEQDQDIKEFLQKAPAWAREKLQREGFPPASINDSDPYREVVHFSPNNDGEVRTSKVHSVEFVTDDEGRTNAFVICYMKGQHPVTNENNGRILVGPVVNPGGVNP